MQTRILAAECFQLDITLKYSKEKMVLDPPAQQWVTEQTSQLERALSEMTEITCFMHEKLGQIHPDVGSVVFLEGDTYPEQQMESITFLLQQLMKVPLALAAEAGNYSHIMQEDIKKFKKTHQQNDYPIEIYTGLLASHSKAKRELEELFFEDTLLMGPFVIRVKELRDSLIKKINALDEVLFTQIKRKIVASTQKIETTVQDVLAVIRNENIKDIEQVTETRDFVKNLKTKEH